MSRWHGHHAGAAARAHRLSPARAGAALVTAALLGLSLPTPTAGNTETRPATPVAQPVLGAPEGMTLIGSSPGEAGGETWGYTNPGFTIERYSDESDTWRPFAPPVDVEGQPLEGFMPANGPLAGSATPGGGVAIVGADAGAGQVLVRNPGTQQFQQAPTLTAEPAGGQPAAPNALLRPGETLSATKGEGVLMSAVEQSGDSHTGVLLVPFEGSASAVQESVLFFDGVSWTREPICAGTEASATCTKPQAGFKVLAIGATSLQNAWLLAQTSAAAEAIALFTRTEEDGVARWVQRPLGAGEQGSLGAQFAHARLSLETASHEPVGVQVAALAGGQPLTVTGQGLWVDGQLGIEVPHHTSEEVSFTLYYDIAKKTVAASWCSPPAAAGAQAAELCTQPLESSLPNGPYRSFAWTGEGQYGERVITGLGNGVSLSLHGATFKRVLGIGGEAGTSAGAAFASPEEGWLGGPLTHLTTSPEADRVQSWPVPFHSPLDAIAEQPGASAGELGAEALAVGDNGQIARYVPGQGWTPEALLTASGEAVREAEAPELRGVAWPTPNRAFAVGTGAKMWLWRAETGLWEPDPARPPNLALANFTGIAFDPSQPLRGYAIGQQGVLLGYGKSWDQEALPEGLAGPTGANFTSIAFAGEEALVTYQIPDPEGSRGYTGGVLANDGSGWHVDTEAEAAVGQLTVPVQVAGLPDGGAALATAGGEVIERQGPGQPWQPAPAGGVNGFPVALALFREGGRLRAVVSIEPGRDRLGNDFLGDELLQQPSLEGEAPVATAPYPLPASGFLLRETPDGWHDEEHADYPVPDHEHGRVDWPIVPDAVLALALSPDGEAGWAVGGQTGEINDNSGKEAVKEIQTAGVMRYPAGGPAPEGFTVVQEQTSPGEATFAIGGGAQCATACADLAADDLGPDVWLADAVARAGETPGVRDFLYTGPHLAGGLGQGGGLDEAAFAREEQSYAELLSSAAGAMGVFAAPSESDLDGEGNLNLWNAAMTGTHAPAAQSPPEEMAKTGAYAFESSGSGGAVRVIVLDYSQPSLGEAQQCWLAEQLAAAATKSKPGGSVPAIVIGNRGIDSPTNGAADAAQVSQTLLTGAPPAGDACRREFEANNLAYGEDNAGASAYFFDSPEQDRTLTLTERGAPPLPEYGDGTLGYVGVFSGRHRLPGGNEEEFLGASGFLLAEVNATAKREADNRAKVRVRLVPDISELALNATGGVLLRRSHPTLFDALARRPQAGLECAQEGGDGCLFAPDPYLPIPSVCEGTGCTGGVFPEYTFTSSEPRTGQFVEADPAEPYGATVLQGANGKPIPDEPREPRNTGGKLTADGRFEEGSDGEPLNETGQVVPREESGLFCAYNAGTTTVTVHAGGLSYSEQVTVRAGSVEQPCGTVPVLHPPVAAEQGAAAVVPPALAPARAVTPSGTLRPPASPPAVPSVPAPVIVPHVQHRPAPAPPPLPPQAQLYPIVALVPPPAPAAARPTPPSGTAQVPAQSPVSQPVSVAEREEQGEGATEMVHHMVAYEHPAEAPLPAWPLALVLLAAAAGVGLRRPQRQLAPVRFPARRTEQENCLHLFLTKR